MKLQENHYRSGDACKNTIMKDLENNKRTQWAGQQVKTWGRGPHNVVDLYVNQIWQYSLQKPKK